MKPTEKMTRAERARANGGTPNSELRELVEEWRERADSPFYHTHHLRHLEECADELEALMDSSNASNSERDSE